MTREASDINPVSVIIADDAPLFRAVLRRLLDSDPRFALVGEASDADGVITLAERHQPDLAVVDVRMGGGGDNACRGIIACSPRTAVVALSASTSPALKRQLAEAGAVDYLSKVDDRVELLDRLWTATR